MARACLPVLVLGLASAAFGGMPQFPSVPAAPGFSQPGGTYGDVIWLALTSDTAGADIRFTTNGAEPTSSSALFTGPFLISTTTTVKAKAFVPGLPPSATTTADYSIHLAVHPGLSVLHVVPHVYAGSVAFLDACLHLDQWPRVLGATTVFGGSEAIATASDADLTTCFANLSRRGLMLSLGVGALDGFGSGAGAFSISNPIWNRLIRLGAPLYELFVDEPLSASSGIPAMTYADAVRETVNWLVLVRTQYSGVKVVLQEAYPFNAASRIIGFVRDVNAAAAARTVLPLDGFELDHDRYGTRWSVDDIFAIHTAVHGARMMFSIILWPNGRDSSNDCDFSSRIYDQYRYTYSSGYLKYGQDFAPDMWSIESWDRIPAATLPETGTCTFMQGAHAIVIQGF